MKTLLLTVGCLLLTMTSFTQSTLGYNNIFKKEKFDELHIVEKGIHSKDTITINNQLKGYIDKISDDRDSMYIKFWGINPGSDSCCITNKKLVNSTNDDKTFAYPIDWDTTRRGVHFDVPFKARALTAASIPFRYRLKSNADLESEFLNVAVTYLFIRGGTRFYNHEQIAPKQWHCGWGPFLAFTQQEIDSSNTLGRVTTKKNVASINYGINGIFSYENFTLVLAIGFDNTLGKSASRWEENNLNDGKLHPWIGFGFGFKLVEFPTKATNSSN